VNLEKESPVSLRHIIAATDLSPTELHKLFWEASTLSVRGKNPQTLAGFVVGLFFYEPSTRTMWSFDSAVKRLGGQTTVTAEAGLFSSAVKGETFEDTIRVVSGYVDLLVLRHPDAGSAQIASTVSSVPVINAGDGAHEHPTQAFLDLYTIWKHYEVSRRGVTYRPLRIVFHGDNRHSRTVRSLALLLATHAADLGIGVESVTFCGSGIYRDPPPDVVVALMKSGIEVTKWTEELPKNQNTDVLYVTRSQKERHGEHSDSVPSVLPDNTLSRLSADGLIMHPLPRTGEIPVSYDSDPRAKYFEQAKNGLYVRMALLQMLLS
jgi:aspartate carbamoyltransferase catalytic subunit